MDQMLKTNLLRVEDKDDHCQMLPLLPKTGKSTICSIPFNNSVADAPMTSYRQHYSEVEACSEAFGIHERFPWTCLALQRLSETGSLHFPSGAIVLNIYGRLGKMTGKIQFQTRRETATFVFLNPKLQIKGIDLPLFSCTVSRSLLSSIARLPRSPSLYHLVGEKLLVKHVPRQLYNNDTGRIRVHGKEENEACKHKNLEQLKIEVYQTYSEVKQAGVGNVELQQELRSHITCLKAEIGNLKEQLFQQTSELKACHDQVLELKGNIRVYCRCRPLTSEESQAGNLSVIEFSPLPNQELYVHTLDGVRKAFKFDHIFTPLSSQEEVFLETAPLVVSVLDGFNVCIFAYGQTGTGKTFTMEGTEDNRGVNYRTLERLFQLASKRMGQCRYEISVSVLEVYNEEIRDLLTSSASYGHHNKKLEIRQLADGMHHLPGSVETPVFSTEDVWKVLQTGSRARVVGSTNANMHSSRSHCLLRVMVKGENLLTGICTKSNLWLIDLAGSERIGKTDAYGERLKEAQNINKSLSALGDVIHALSSKSSHIPYRNSKLTHLLQDSLGGQSKTLMFVQISPSEHDIGETLCSLNFASRVRGVELGAARKQLDPAEALKYKKMVEKIKEDALKKDAIIAQLQAAAKVKEQTCKTLCAKVKEMEGLFALERKARATTEEKLREQQTLLEKQRLTIEKLSAERRAKQSTPLPESVEHTMLSASTPRRPPLQERPMDNGEQTVTQQKKQGLKGFVQKENLCNEVDMGTLPVKHHRSQLSLNITQCQGLLTPSAIPAPKRRALQCEEPSEEVLNLKRRGRASMCVLPQRQSSLREPGVAPSPIAKFGEPRMRMSMACSIDPAGQRTYTRTSACRLSMVTPQRIHLASPHVHQPGFSSELNGGEFQTRPMSNINSNVNVTRGKPPRHPHQTIVHQELQYQPKRQIERTGNEVGHPMNKMRRLSDTTATPLRRANLYNSAMPFTPSTPGHPSLVPHSPLSLASDLLAAGTQNQLNVSHHRTASSGRFSMAPCIKPWGVEVPSMMPQRVPLSARKAGVSRNRRGNY